MIRSAAIRAAAAHCYVLPMRRPSRPRAFAQITQEVRSRIKQFGKQTGVAGLPTIAERKRGVAAHRKAEPADQCDSRRKASPLCKSFENAAAVPRRERDYLATCRVRFGGYRTGSRDDPFETDGRPFGIGKLGRPHVCRGLRICGEQGGDSLALLDIEEPIGMGGEVEKSRRLVLVGIDGTASLPEAAVRRVWPVFWSLALHHGNVFLRCLRRGQLKHPRNRGVHSTSARKWARSLIIALWWALRTVCGSIPRARATSETSMSRSYNIVKISRWRGDSRTSGSLSLRTGSTGSIARRPSGTVSIGTDTGRCRRIASRAVLRATIVIQVERPARDAS